MSIITKSLSRMDVIYNDAYAYGEKKRRSGSKFETVNPFDPTGAGHYLGNQLQGASEARYSLFRGWVHAAVNALAMSAASSDCNVGKLRSKSDKDGPNRLKTYQRRRMPEFLRNKAAEEEMEVMASHPLLASLEHPNSMQGRWQFVYSFVCNLCLTGWGFIITSPKEDSKDEWEFYSVPSTWIRPDHSEGAFSKFYIVNPKQPGEGFPLDREQVQFAHLPNPSDPMGALSPAGAQLNGIKIDDYIQSSQQVFFKNGVFPSVLVTVGKDPHPNVPGGLRPRLTPGQRRQVYSAIRKVMSGVSNYGEPAILDGFIDKIERLSATQNEMGWEKSEKAVRTRILSAFGVHPFILGEEMAGSYAQAYIVQDLFFDRVNTFLSMLSNLMTQFAITITGDKNLSVWWEEKEARAPDMEKSLWEGARSRDDVTQDEFRAYMGLPPDEDGNETHIPKQSLQAVTAVATSVASDAISPEQGKAILEGLGIPSDLAKKIAGKPKPKEKPPAMIPGQAPGQPPGAFGKPGQPIPPGQQPPAPNGQQKPEEQQPVQQQPPPEPKQEQEQEQQKPKPPKKDYLDSLMKEYTTPISGVVDDILKSSSVGEGLLSIKGDFLPLYVSRPVMNREDIEAWARGQGLPKPDSDLHVTIAYSKTAVDWDLVGRRKSELFVDGSGRSVEILGSDNALVLMLDSPELERRHKDILSVGASWDHSEYRPHVTITYDSEGVDVNDIEPYRGEIVLGPESLIELRD